MSMLDNLMSAASGLDLAGLGTKVGLSPDQVQMALGALAKMQAKPGDTAHQASDETGLPHSKISDLLQQVGGEDALGRVMGMLGGAGGTGGLAGMASGMFGRK